MKTFDLLIISTNGKEKIVMDVDDYGITSDIFWFSKNELKSFLPMNNIFFIGRADDYKNPVDL